MGIIECVPNISEGRRLEVVEAIAGSATLAAGVHLLDRSSDASHNRCVLTLAGEAGPLRHAVLHLFEAALRLIDLRAHRGEHPRLGAVDVVPFIPIHGVSIADCVRLAHETAAEVASRFGVPVFLYEAAASSEGRRNLENIRRGQFEGLAAKMALPEWAPDYGPAHPHPTAGATVIGARAPLVAFNVNLDTDRVDIAKAIARAVRSSNGGLPNVKAIGVALPDRALAQVSMNLTNFEETPIVRVFETVRAEAARLGTEIFESEIVGLVPAAALPDAAVETLKLAGFRDDQVLEERLRTSKASNGF